MGKNEENSSSVLLSAVAMIGDQAGGSQLYDYFCYNAQTLHCISGGIIEWD